MVLKPLAPGILRNLKFMSRYLDMVDDRRISKLTLDQLQNLAADIRQDDYGALEGRRASRKPRVVD
jgi:hypothetical protein